MNSDFPTRVEQIVTGARKILGGSKDRARSTLAQHLGISSRQLYKWSAGAAQPKDAEVTLKRLAAALHELQFRGVHEQQGGSALVQELSDLKRKYTELERRLNLLEGRPDVAAHKPSPKEVYFLRRINSLEEL